MSKVYFLKLKEKDPQKLIEAGRKISGLFSNFFDSNDKVAIKLHFGEEGSDTYLRPVLVRAIYENLKNKVKEIALVDCTVLYRSQRALASSHEKLAKEHGFDFAPIEILDGEKGDEEIKISVGQKHFSEVKIGRGLESFNSILAISHLTGHILTGFGGALKNVGMGLGSKGGKLEMHQAFKLKIRKTSCLGCGICQRECPAEAITIKNNKAEINQAKCIGCGKCITVCSQGAVEIPWADSSSRDLQERIVEYTFGVLKNRKAFFVNVLMDITPGCDCQKGKQQPMMEDIGLLGSSDIVAIDQASLDLAGKNNFEKSGVDPAVKIDYAQKLGLGNKKYQLIEI